ncbi:MAG: ankyrin repeat domain-containing protein, partial [Kiloniellales bacterium]|nr:ankyrin repeat domain-containing protein [Kiloniellales bacterium]
MRHSAIRRAGRISLVLLLAWSFAARAQSEAPDSLERALLEAAFVGDADLALYALERGAAPDARTRDGLTALHLASALGHLAVVELLLDH